MENKKYVVLVAGGSGTRMGAEIPKQFLKVNNQTILEHTIQAFYNYDSELEIILVLPANQIEYWQFVASKSTLANQLKRIKIAIGGATRFDSVLSGLNEIHENGLVAIHDAVRPFVSKDLISKCFRVAEEKGCGIAAIPCTDTVRQKNENGFQILDRSQLWMMQTPQTFQIDKLKLAYSKATHNQFTDDAAVFENAGNEIQLVEGEKNNLKITVPADLEFAEWLILQK